MEKRRNLMLYYFGEKSLKSISDVCGSFDITNNNERADEIAEIVRPFGFVNIGTGTNRTVIAADDDYAIKIALDRRGIKDNYCEEYFNSVPELDRKTIVYQNSGLIEFHNRVRTMDKYDFEDYRDVIMEHLRRWSKIFLLNDLGETTFKNWGLDENDEPVLLDYANLTLVKHAAITHCKKCGAPIVYDKQLLNFICTNEKCERVYYYNEVAGTQSINGLYEQGYYSPDFTITDDISSWTSV